VFRPHQAGSDARRGRGDSRLGVETASFDQIQAAAGPQAEPPVSVAISAPATPAASDTPPPKKSKNAPPPAANTPGGFQRADVNASQSDAAKQSNAAAAANGNTPASDDLTKSASDGFLVNGTSNNGAASPFATNPAFGNNRLGNRGLYNGGIGFILDNSTTDARPYSITGQDTPRPEYNKFTGNANLIGPLKIRHWFVTPPNFYIGYQWLRNRVANTTPGLMPTPAQTMGDFSTLSTMIIDPTTGLAFPNNMIPSNRIVTQAMDLLKLYPAPNFPGTQYNYQLALVNPTHQDSLNSRSEQDHQSQESDLGSIRVSEHAPRDDQPARFYRHHRFARAYHECLLASLLHQPLVFDVWVHLQPLRDDAHSQLCV
jgi:hypothetical protein